MGPPQASSYLRHVATKIDNSSQPRADLVARSLCHLLLAVSPMEVSEQAEVVFEQSRSNKRAYEGVVEQLKAMARGGDPDPADPTLRKRLYPEWSDKDFQSLLSELEGLETAAG